MRIEAAALLAPIREGGLVLEQFEERHREGLRAACAADSAIWQMYPTDWGGHFDACFDAVLRSAGRCPFVIELDGRTLGMSGYLNFALDREALEIGNSYIMPETRGTGLNGRIKRVLLDRAFGCGIRRVEFRIDERNARSQAAVLKLGATKEGVLRAERVTWTGHVRDTAVYSILAHEWGAEASARA
jgi:RimJ/RimL family protein N-acetyltransferase